MLVVPAKAGMDNQTLDGGPDKHIPPNGLFHFCLVQANRESPPISSCESQAT